MSDNEVKCGKCKCNMTPQVAVGPKCGCKKKSIFLKWWFWLILAVIVIALICSMCGKGESMPESSSVPESSMPESSSESAPTVYTIGDTVTVDGTEITLEAVTEYPGSKFNQPTEGNIFIISEFTIKNITDKDIIISSKMHFEAMADGSPVKQVFIRSKEVDGKGQLDGTIAPGKKMKGVVIYEVPMNYSEFIIKFKPTISDEVIFSYKK